VPLLATGDGQMRADDRALCYELVLGTLRRQLWLDHLIEHYSNRKALGLDAPVRLALRLGLYQLRFLTRIPASAVVNESVNLAHVSRLRSAASFINAVLRRATREADYDPAAGVNDVIERLSIETSHPRWLTERWSAAFGFEEAKAFAHVNNEAPPVAFRIVNNRAGEVEVLDELRAAGGHLLPSGISPDAWRIEGAGAALRRLAQAGKIYIQDEASQLVAHVLGAKEGERVLDVCAAPGSKTTHIAGKKTRPSLVVAGDVHRHRLQTVLESGARQEINNLRVLLHNAESVLPFPAGSFDRVLVDAPCTGTGTLRRNPEIRWRISAADILDLSRRQRRILANSARMVRPRGRLVYSTCSVEREENEEVITSFLRENTDFKEVDTSPAPDGLRVTGGAVRIWPHRDGADGFFITTLERVG
jgi:16S rRNA (cytosine967-C5)-methyltransferase